MFNPFSAMRRNQMFQQPVNRQSDMGGFNPAMQDDSDAYPFTRPPFQMPPFIPPTEGPQFQMPSFDQSPSAPPTDTVTPPKRFATGVDPSHPGSVVGPVKEPSAAETILSRRSPRPTSISRPDLQQFEPGFTGPREMDAEPPLSREQNAQSYFEQMQKMRSPERRPHETAYQEALNAQPTAKDYQPSKWRRLAAIMGGAAGGFSAGPAAGMKIANEINSQPERQIMSDYERRIAGLKEQAGMEAQQLDDEVKDLKTAHDMGIDYSKLGIEEEKLGVQKREAGIAEARSVTEWYDAQSKAQERIAQIDHLYNQDISAQDRIILDKERQRTLAELQKAQAGLANATAKEQPGRTKAAQTAANRPRAGGKPNYKEARQEAYSKLFADPKIAKFGAIIENTGAGGGYKIDESKVNDPVGPNGETIGKLIELEMQKILERQVTSGSSDDGYPDETPEGGSNYYGGPS